MPPHASSLLPVESAGMVRVIPTARDSPIPLTDARCRAAKGTEQVQKLSDQRGLYLAGRAQPDRAGLRGGCKRDPCWP